LFIVQSDDESCLFCNKLALAQMVKVSSSSVDDDKFASNFLDINKKCYEDQ
jgi:hypothetical protein